MNQTKRTSPWSWIPTLYFAEALPYVAVMTISVIMYKRLGISNTDIVCRFTENKTLVGGDHAIPDRGRTGRYRFYHSDGSFLSGDPRCLLAGGFQFGHP